MASLRVLTFDYEGRPIQFDTWLGNLQLLSDSRDSVSLFDHTSRASLAPPAIADSATHSQWLTRDAAARSAIRNHLPLAECAHFGQHKTTRALYDAVVARYSSPATAALDRLILPYLFPELSAFATVEDLVTQLRTSNARYHAALPAEFLDRNPPPPMYITLYFIVTRLPNSLRAVPLVGLLARPSLRGVPPPPLAPPTPLLLLLTSLVLRMLGLLLLVGSAAPARQRVVGVVEVAAGVIVGVAVEVVEVAEVVAAVGVVAGVGALVAAVVAAVGVAAVAAVGVVALGVELFRGGVLAMARGSSSSVGARPLHPSNFVSGLLSVERLGHRSFSCLDNAWRAEFDDKAECPRWAELLRSGVDIFALDYDAILAAMYALSVSAEGDCYLCVPPDPGIEVAALGASEYALPGTAPAEALYTFTLNSSASRCFFRDSTTLTPLPVPVPVRLADPSRGPIHARSSTGLPCLAVPSGSLSGLHLPSFSTNLVSTILYDGHYHHSWGSACIDLHVYTDDSSLATFTRPPGSSLYTLATEPPQIAASAELSSSPPALACPALPSLRRGEAVRHSSLHLVSPATAPLQTLHMDVWGPARVSGQDCERYFLLVIDDYTRYTTVFPLHSKSEVLDVLIPWICTVRLQLRERFRQVLSCDCTLTDVQNGTAERRIGLVMEVALTSMIHAAAPHFLWPFAVRYTAHHLNLWPRVLLPNTSPTVRWTGKVGDASVFRVWVSRALVRDTSADNLSARTISCVFLGFSLDTPGWQFYHSTLRPVLPSQDITFDESIPFYRLFPYRSAPLPPPSLFLAPGPPPVDPLPPQGPAPSGVSQVDPFSGIVPVEVAVASGAARGAVSGGAEPTGAEPWGA
ncbi:unnamed protein product [Closterium sp. NIES-54]